MSVVAVPGISMTGAEGGSLTTTLKLPASSSSKWILVPLGLMRVTVPLLLLLPLLVIEVVGPLAFLDFSAVFVVVAFELKSHVKSSRISKSSKFAISRKKKKCVVCESILSPKKQQLHRKDSSRKHI